MITKKSNCDSLWIFCDTREEQWKELKQQLKKTSITKIKFWVHERLSKKGQFYIKVNLDFGTWKTYWQIPVWIRTHQL